MRKARLVSSVALLLLAVLFALQNIATVEVQFLF
jgi:uncharacterized integral membrane protein